MSKLQKLLLSAIILILAGCLIVCYYQKETLKENMTMEKDFLQLATERYSVRHFSSQAVPQEKIDLILEAAKLAPTAVNSQPQMIYVLTSPEAVAKANELTPCMYGAPHAFLVCYDDTRVCSRGENDNWGDVDCSIVITHMLLEASNIGLGTCAVGRFNPEEAIEAFNLPRNMHPVLMIPFGYPADDAQPSERHTTYRNHSEMVRNL